MEYNIFLDETGDHGLSYIDKNYPLFLLCGCIVDNRNLSEIEEKIKDFKIKFFNTTKVILHSRDIRKCEGAFQILFDLSIKEAFYKELNKILSESIFCLIGSAVNKKSHIKKYGRLASDPYSLSLSFVIERLIFYLDNAGPDSLVRIFAEERGKKEDSHLLAHYNSIISRGTYYVTTERIKQKIIGLSFHSKRENIIGLQIADLCAYPLARHLLNPDEPYVPFQIIEKKIYRNNKRNYEGWGLKVFP